ncbi:LysE family translocator [Planosporangium mesophilum]|uniref:Lysine transporter LysE n=1 Tax=Planosporangium mesophilum TaxID=689768 RepID=A0A8J3TAW7_9ACTN|nr:LysE family translocator [Planosporangium mesophilum]NJC82731.1 LysE family translocator [Planosporangium mesophilum]GII23800.1 lysine transporter LysE [Planosporangium mesophilum]
MTWSSYASFLAFAVALVLAPGPDFAVVTKNTLASGRWRGAWSGVGVACSNAVQGTAAAAGLGALIVRAQPVLEVVRWAGVAYLSYLGIQAIRSAVRGRYPALDPDTGGRAKGAALGGWRQGFLSNITNPKVLVFYLAVLPQFLAPGAGSTVLLAFALSHALLSLLYLLMLTTFLHRVRRFLTRRRVRRTLDTATGVALLGFGTRLAADRV